jgi:hypothetical protein
MSTRGVVIVRQKGEKPSYFYLRSDAHIYPDLQKKISGKNAREYAEKVNRHVATKVEGYNDKEYREFLRKKGVNPDLLRNIDETEAKNYISSSSVARPDNVYIVDLDGRKKLKRYDYPHCGSNEVYVPAYVKDDGTYVKGYCRKR